MFSSAGGDLPHPRNLGSLQSPRSVIFGPGGGAWCSAVYVFVYFAQTQIVPCPLRHCFLNLWLLLNAGERKKKKKKSPVKFRNPLRRKRADLKGCIRGCAAQRGKRGCQVCNSVHAWLWLILEGGRDGERKRGGSIWLCLNMACLQQTRRSRGRRLRDSATGRFFKCHYPVTLIFFFLSL